MRRIRAARGCLRALTVFLAVLWSTHVAAEPLLSSADDIASDVVAAADPSEAPQSPGPGTGCPIGCLCVCSCACAPVRLLPAPALAVVLPATVRSTPPRFVSVHPLPRTKPEPSLRPPIA